MNSSNFYNKTPNKSLSCITKNPILNQNQGNIQTQKQSIQNFNSFDQQQLISERLEFNSKIFNLRNQNNSEKFSLQDSQNSLILSQFSHRNDYKFTSSMSPLKKNHIKNLELESSLNQNQNQIQKQKNKILNANLEPMQNNHLPYIDAFISKTPKHQNIKFQKINEHNSEIHLQKQFKNDEREQPVQIQFIKNEENEYQLTQNSVKNQINSPLKKKTGSQTNILQLKQSPKNLHSINQSENISNIQNIPLILKQSKKSIKPKYQFSDSNLQLSPNSHEKTQHTNAIQSQKLNNLQSPTSNSNQQFKKFISNISSSNQQTEHSSLLSKNLQNQQQRNSSLDTIKNGILSQKRQQIPQFNNFSKRKSMKNLTYKQEKIDLLILLKRLTAHYNSTEQKLTQKLSQIIFQILNLLSQEQDNKYGNDMLIFFQIINQMIFCQDTEIINMSQNKQNEQQEILPYFQSNLRTVKKR
ncbi:hypothetical protein PPERSA_08320 [Pseudocohnilembus persalinus]|uniref:Uncharacterized protein n=1 Tax=Pseudocohnilembus persalinus TaxID=266149 RepID=A0A0V0QP67_PSEPJ|nr:hypothetical protein PPERSA_08320 [Pseudocohnilembus persalinus]|eukprot:KRX04105.1 hypothetical protein PPERSA_08320 [Pseudocohnilembus persalinus]